MRQRRLRKGLAPHEQARLYRGEDDTIVIRGIKSPKEGLTSSSWRQIQPNDSQKFKAVRLGAACREPAGRLSKQLDGHEMIIRGQIADYVAKIGQDLRLPITVLMSQPVGRYTMPSHEAYMQHRHRGLAERR